MDEARSFITAFLTLFALTLTILIHVLQGVGDPCKRPPPVGVVVLTDQISSKVSSVIRNTSSAGISQLSKPSRLKGILMFLYFAHLSFKRRISPKGDSISDHFFSQKSCHLLSIQTVNIAEDQMLTEEVAI